MSEEQFNKVLDNDEARGRLLDWMLGAGLIDANSREQFDSNLKPQLQTGVARVEEQAKRSLARLTHRRPSLLLVLALLVIRLRR